MILFLLQLATIPLTLRTINLAFSSQLIDFSFYMEAASYLSQGLDPYISLLYPPASLLLFLPFYQLPFTISKIIWTSLSLLCLFAGIKNLVKEFKLSNFFSSRLSPTNTSLIFFLLFMQTFPVKFSLSQGQINFFVFFGLTLLVSTLRKNQDLLSGLILAILTIIKFSPIFFVLYFIITKKTKATLSFIFLFIFLNLFIDHFYHQNLNISFIQSLLFMTNNYSTYYYNQSLAAFIGRQFTSSEIAKIVNNTTSIFLWINTLRSVKTFTGHTHRNVSLFLVTILLTSPLTWQHHLILTIPIFMYLLSKFSRPYFSPLNILTVISFILVNSNLKNPQMLSMQNPIYSHAFLGLLLLFLILILKTKGNIKQSIPTPSS